MNLDGLSVDWAWIKQSTNETQSTSETQDTL